MKRLSLILLVLCSFSFAFGQEKADSLRLDSAMESYQNYDFERVIKLLKTQNEPSFEAWRILAKAYQKVGQLEEAKTAYLEAYEIDSQSVSVRNELAVCLLNLGDDQAAIKLYQELIEEQPKNAFYQRKLALIYDAQKEVIPAVLAYTKALELNPADLASAVNLSALYHKLQQYKAADSLIEHYLSTYPNNPNLLKAALKTAYKLRAYQKVTDLAEQLFAASDSSLISQKIAGIAYFHEKEYEKAIQLIENVIAVDRDSEILHYYLGLSYRELGEGKKATALLEKAIDLGVSENLGNYYLQLAVSFEEQENYPEAIKAYQVAYKSTKDKVILYHLARSYDRYYKDKSIALSYYEKYLEEEDTANQFLQNYSKHRIEELKVARHFELDSLN